MDTQTPTPPPAAAPTPPPASSPAPSPLPPTSSPEVVHSSGMMKKVIIGVVVLIVIALVGGGAYYYVNMYQNQPSSNQSSVPTYTPKPSTTPGQNSLENQANSVNEPPVENDLKPVDQDLNSLNATSSASPSANR